MTQSAITSALNGKVSNGSTTGYLPGINIDQNGAYIYGDGSGNILFRYKGSSSATDYIYTNMVNLRDAAYSFIAHGCLSSGTDLNGVDRGTWMLAGTYPNCPFNYGTLLCGGADSYFMQLAVSTAKDTYVRFRDERGNWTYWSTILTNTRYIDTDFYNTQDIVYGTSSAAIRFTGGTAWGIVKNPNSLQIVNDTSCKFRFQNTYCYCDVGLNSTGIYNSTAASAANMYINSNGFVYRSTSASKYKLDIKPIEEDASYPYKLLKLTPKQWFDKNGIERYSDLLTKEYNGEEIDKEEQDVANSVNINPYYGLIAEDVEEVGLSKFCEYGKEDKDGNKELEGIMYDRLPILMIPILKDVITLLKEIVPVVKEKITDKEVLEKINEILDRMK